jgi:RsiW-degrading membrane proteinase PrsW (M82 family)
VPSFEHGRQGACQSGTLGGVACARCGTPLAEGWRYCPACGRRADRPVALRLGQRWWWRVLAAGLLLYLVAVKLLPGNPNIAPMAIVLGAFLAPVAYVTYLYESEALYDVPTPTVALIFFSGGLLGVLAAQVIAERAAVGVLGVAFAEELAKPLGALWLARQASFRDARHGFLLGAAAGMGFAAFETMGYAFRFLLQSGGNVDLIGQVLLTRGVLSPLAHATWTALVVGVFWREGRRINPAVLLAFAAAVVLHAAWNWTASEIPIEIAIGGVEWRWRFVDLAVPELSLPLPALVVGALGLWVLGQVSRGRRLPSAGSAPASPPASGPG